MTRLLFILFLCATTNSYGFYWVDDYENQMSPRTFNEKAKSFESVSSLTRELDGLNQTCIILAPTKILATRSIITDNPLSDYAEIAPSFFLDGKPIQISQCDFYPNDQVDLAILTLNTPLTIQPCKLSPTTKTSLARAILVSNGYGRVLFDWSQSGPNYKAYNHVLDDFAYQLNKTIKPYHHPYHRVAKIEPKNRAFLDPVDGFTKMNVIASDMIVGESDRGAALFNIDQQLIGVVIQGDPKFIEDEKDVEAQLASILSPFRYGLICGFARALPFTFSFMTGFVICNHFGVLNNNLITSVGRVAMTGVGIEILVKKLNRAANLDEPHHLRTAMLQYFLAEPYMYAVKPLDHKTHNRLLRYGRTRSEDELFSSQYLIFDDKIRAWINENI